MNDIGYLDLQFKDDMLEQHIKQADEEGLKNYLCLSKGAVKYHIREQNPNQVKFFSEAVKLCEKRLKKYCTK
jgi:hypothetical protein